MRSATTLCVAATVFVHASTAQSSDWQEAVVKLHNDARALYSAGPVAWSDNLNSGTSEWATQCIFQHSAPGQYGENLAAGQLDLATGFQLWMDESVGYNYSSDVFQPPNGHFTQIVWKATTQVACSLASCPAGTIDTDSSSNLLVCRYFPPGNVEGEFRDNVGPPVLIR